jgi:type IV pilus assembly protein PilV
MHKQLNYQRYLSVFKKKQHCDGFTLLEVLIAMLILAIGVLGVTALQYKALQYNQDAYYRTQVNTLASDMADRMRLNSDNASEYTTAITNYRVPTVAPTGCVQSGATATGKSNDVTCWQLQLFNTLAPRSRANISNIGDTYTISLEYVVRSIAHATDATDEDILSVPLEYKFRL